MTESMIGVHAQLTATSNVQTKWWTLPSSSPMAMARTSTVVIEVVEYIPTITKKSGLRLHGNVPERGLQTIANLQFVHR